MATTYTLIASSTAGSGGASSIDFTSIPSTYTDLVLKISLRQNQANNNIRMTFNGSSSGYSERMVFGTGSSAASTSASATYFNLMYSDGTGETSNTFSNNEIYIPNYAGSAAKSYSAETANENNATYALSDMRALLWSGTAAITQIQISAATGNNLAQYSTAYLYGISKS